MSLFVSPSPLSPTTIVVRRVSDPVTAVPVDVPAEGPFGLGRGRGGRNFPFSVVEEGLVECTNTGLDDEDDPDEEEDNGSVILEESFPSCPKSLKFIFQDSLLLLPLVC